MNEIQTVLGTMGPDLTQILFLMLRSGAAMLAAPLFGAISVPVQLRAILGLALAVFVSAHVPLPVLPDMLSVTGLVAMLQEIVIGVALGFVLQISFAIPLIAAEQISGTMGMAMATAIDPSSGTQSGAIGQFFNLLLIFIFLSLGAHLLWLKLMIESYQMMPPGGASFSAGQAMQIVDFAGVAIATAAAVALPVVLVLLLVQLVTGVLSRSAPALNLFALGLPAGVLAGIAALIAVLPLLTDQFTEIVEMAITQAAGVVQP